MSIFGAIASIAGGLIGAHSAKKSQERQHEYEIQMAQNAHQWEVEDLKKAGLNPILSAGGSGASGSTSAGSSAYDFGSTANSAYANYLASQKQKAEIENINANTAKTLSDNLLNGKMLAEKDANIKFLTQQYVNSAKQFEILDEQKNSVFLDNALKRASIPRASAEGTLWSSAKDFIDEGIKRTGQAWFGKDYKVKYHG